MKAILVLSLALVAACGKGDAGQGSRSSRGKLGVARAMTKKLAFEAYPQYAMKPGNQGKCPSADELGVYFDAKPGFTDPWGNAYEVVCGGPQGITVSSSGPDGVAATGDDLTSNDD